MTFITKLKILVALQICAEWMEQYGNVNGIVWECGWNSMGDRTVWECGWNSMGMWMEQYGNVDGTVWEIEQYGDVDGTVWECG